MLVYRVLESVSCSLYEIFSFVNEKINTLNTLGKYMKVISGRNRIKVMQPFEGCLGCTVYITKNTPTTVYVLTAMKVVQNQFTCM